MSSEETATRGPTLAVLAAAGISGVAGYVVMVLAARGLAAADTAQFLEFWGALFAVFGVLIGITTETTRAVHASTSGGKETSSDIAVLPVTLGLGAVVVAIMAVASPWWGPGVLEDDWTLLTPAMILGVALFVVHTSLGGAAAGLGDWSAYSLLVGSEATVRLVLCGVVALVGATLGGLAWAVASACGTWLLLCAGSPRYRALWRVRADVDRSGLVRRLMAACAASGVSALLLVGYPVLLGATTSDEVFDSAAPILLAVSLCRAPLLVPLGAYQNVVVTRVAAHGLRALVPVVMVLGCLTAVGSLAAWPIGPWTLRVINPHFHVAGPVFAALVLGAGLVALLTMTGAATVGRDRHGTYLAGWIVATLCSLVVLSGPGDLEQRVVTSLVVGPVAGVAVHLIGLLGRRAHAPVG